MDIKNITKDISLKTDRIEIRNFKSTDLKDLFSFLKIPGLGESVGFFHHKDIEESKKALEAFIREGNELALVFDKKVVGSFNLSEIDHEFFQDLDPDKALKIIFIMDPSLSKEDLMDEALRAFFDHLFTKTGVENVISSHFRGNFPYKKTLTSLNFTYYSSHLIKTKMATQEVSHEYVLNRDDFYKEEVIEDEEEKNDGDFIKNTPSQKITSLTLKKGEEKLVKSSLNNLLVIISQGLINFKDELYLSGDMIIDEKELKLRALRDSKLYVVHSKLRKEL